jgi:glycosyltransferase involved in cell wall biosynthesis
MKTGKGQDKKTQKITAIIPALNEEKTIENVMRSIKNYVDEIILIDDGSKDKTAKIAAQDALVIKHEKNLGYDQSLNDGFKTAKERGAGIIITLDADGQHLTEDVPKLVQPIIAGEADVVTGKRPYPARFMEKVFGKFGRKFGISDPLCGMKAYSVRVYDEIGFFDNITSIGTQLALTAVKKGYKVTEIPIQLRKREDVPRFGRKVKANLKLFLAYLRVKKYLGQDQNMPETVRH